MTRRQAQTLYRAIYKAADAIFKTHNPCRIRPAYVGPEGQPKQSGVVCTGGTGCCQGCKHLGPTGCTVMSLGCKLWLCSKLQRENTLVAAKINMLKSLVRTFGLPIGTRTTFEQDFSSERYHDFKTLNYLPLRQVWED